MIFFCLRCATNHLCSLKILVLKEAEIENRGRAWCACVFYLCTNLQQASMQAGVCCRPVASSWKRRGLLLRGCLLGGMRNLPVTELQQHAGDNVSKQWELRSTKLESELASVGCCAVKRMPQAWRPQALQSAFRSSVTQPLVLLELNSFSQLPDSQTDKGCWGR